MPKKDILVVRMRRASVAFALLLTGFFVTGKANAACGATASDEGTDLVIESIELKRRNWENHGTDVRIEEDGTFVVTAEYLGKSKRVRAGAVESHDLEGLVKSLEDADFFALPDEYKAPFKTQWSWWGYQLTIRANRGSKTVRFHSEDETVPESLNRIVEDIMRVTQ